ncbi:MAG: class I SAM-dependent methyltransferase [Porticoccaceae bacterium]|nr:class I SAM-dependent methyltransferase [Porticoccaceae bacterium]
MAAIKPFSQACANNCQPILTILEPVFANTTKVLEIGSGTGQHAVFFAPALSHLIWQPSDRSENIAGIHAWLEEYPADNLRSPLTLDVTGRWPTSTFDGFFTANTCHIMPWSAVVAMFEGIGRIAQQPATLVIYGPFKYGGKFTTASNAAFDGWLKSQAPHQGIRDSEAIIRLAEDIGFNLQADNAMPANNQLLVFRGC